MIGIFNKNSLRFRGIKEEDTSLEDTDFLPAISFGFFCPALSDVPIWRVGNTFSVRQSYNLFIVFPSLYSQICMNTARVCFSPQGQWIHVHSFVLGSELGSALQLLLPSAGDFPGFPGSISYTETFGGGLFGQTMSLHTSSFKSMLVSNCPIYNEKS